MTSYTQSINGEIIYDGKMTLRKKDDKLEEKIIDKAFIECWKKVRGELRLDRDYQKKRYHFKVWFTKGWKALKSDKGIRMVDIKRRVCDLCEEEIVNGDLWAQAQFKIFGTSERAGIKTQDICEKCCENRLNIKKPKHLKGIL